MAATATAFVMAIGASTVLHPAWGALDRLLQIVGALIIARTAGDLLRAGQTRWISRPIAAFTFVQLVVCSGQVLHRAPLGWPLLDEREMTFRSIGGLTVPPGTLRFANIVGVLAAISIGILTFLLAQDGTSVRKIDRFAMLASVPTNAALVGLSVSRTATLALLLTLAALLASRYRRAVLPLVLLTALAFTAGAFVQRDAWLERGRSSAAGVETAGSGRVALARQAVAIFELQPVFGVGPAGYFSAMSSHPDIEELATERTPVHNAPLYVLATLGVVGLLGLAALATAIMHRSVRGGPASLTLIAVVIPPMLLDANWLVGGLTWIAVAIGLACAAFGRSTVETPAGPRI